MSNFDILIFTFSPVQSFISEARRTADLFAGSRIIAELAAAAAMQIFELNANVIYPVLEKDGNDQKSDVPNMIVAKVPSDQATAIAKQATEALYGAWQNICNSAASFLHIEREDQILQTIWKRQTDAQKLWQVYWVAQPMKDTGNTAYKDAYKEAKNALDAVKRSRLFSQIEEPGMKDSLSGMRESLHRHQQPPKDFWKGVSERNDVTPSMLRPEGRELLDSIGAVKRFCGLVSHADQPFYSTSTIAAWSFLQRAKTNAITELDAYRGAVEALLGEQKYRVSNEFDFPYDGDLLFLDTLTPQRLSQSYGITKPDLNKLKKAQEKLNDLYRKCDSKCDKPSPYYAILMMDGDGIGKAVDKCANDDDHKKLSEQLSNFAARVANIIPDGFRIYNGGDDVLAFASVDEALSKAKYLSEEFKKALDNECTLSGGIAIVHHLSPLSNALEAVRAAEKYAKQAKLSDHEEAKKNAIAIRVLKRSGEDSQVYSRWDELKDHFDKMIERFSDNTLSTRLPYDVIRVADVLVDATNNKQPKDETLKNMQLAELRRLIGRHSDKAKLNDAQRGQLAQDWLGWAQHMPGGMHDLGRWLALARFIATGGQD